MEIDRAKPNNPTPPSENVAGFQLTLLFSNSRSLRSYRHFLCVSLFILPQLFGENVVKFLNVLDSFC